MFAECENDKMKKSCKKDKAFIIKTFLFYTIFKFKKRERRMSCSKKLSNILSKGRVNKLRYCLCSGEGSVYKQYEIVRAGCITRKHEDHK